MRVRSYSKYYTVLYPAQFSLCEYVMLGRQLKKKRIFGSVGLEDFRVLGLRVWDGGLEVMQSIAQCYTLHNVLFCVNM